MARKELKRYLTKCIALVMFLMVTTSNLGLFQGNNSFGLAIVTEAAATSTLKLTNASSPTSITQGSGFTCKGTITSNYKIEKVTVGIWDSSNKEITKYSVFPNAYSYDINKLDILLHHSDCLSHVTRIPL